MRKVAKNTSIIIAGEVIFRIISLFVTIYLARYLGTVGFGKYNFVFAYLAFFGIITDLGLQTILVREMSRNPSVAPKLIGNAYIIRFILTVFAVALALIIISFMPYPPDTTSYVYIAAFTLLFLSFNGFYVTIFQTNLRMEYYIIAKLVFKVLSAVLILWIIFVLQGTLAQIILVLVFSEGIGTMINYYFSRKFVSPRFDIDFKLWRYLFKEALPVALSSVFWIIYYQTDIVMLSLMKGDAEVGLYSAAYKLYEPLTLIPSAFAISLLPIMSASFKSSKDTLIKSYRLGFRYLQITTLPIAVGITLLAHKIISLIYGAEFASSATVLQILVWGLAFTSANVVITNLLVSIGKQNLTTLSTLLCAIANVILNFILIPILSYNGASIATVVTKVIGFIIGFYCISKYFQKLSIFKVIIKPTISGLIMAAFVYYFIQLNIFLLVSLAGAVYLAALFVLKEFQKEDMDLVRKIFKRG